MVLMATLLPWHFSQKIHRIFPSINHRQSVNTQPTHHLAFVWLAGFWPLSLQGMSGQGCPPTKISTFTKQKRHSHWPYPPHLPRGLYLGPPTVAAGSQTPGLCAPTLLDGSPPGFSSTAKASLLGIAGRLAKKFCLKLDTVFKNPDIYIFPFFVAQKALSLMSESITFFP